MSGDICHLLPPALSLVELDLIVCRFLVLAFFVDTSPAIPFISLYRSLHPPRRGVCDPSGSIWSTADVDLVVANRVMWDGSAWGCLW